MVSHDTFDVEDVSRGRVFPIDVWSRAERAGAAPLVLYSHSSGGNRRSSSFLCQHLARHGYVVAALDHSEVVAPELRRRDRETPEERAARVDAMIAARVPDLRFLLDRMLQSGEHEIDDEKIGLVGHSFGGWTVLAMPEVDPRPRSVVALVPGGSDHPLPGIIPAKLTFRWTRDLPVLFIAAEEDEWVPVEKVTELYDRTRSPKRIFVRRHAGHEDFVDSAGEDAHRVVSALTLAHFDATLRGDVDAARLLDEAAEAEAQFVYHP